MTSSAGNGATEAGRPGPDGGAAVSLPGGRRQPPKRLLWGAVAAAVCAAAVGIGWVLLRSTAVVVPELPDLSGQPRAVVEHLRGAHAAAKLRPSAEALGALGMAYHADLFYDQALQCYDLADQLAPEEWRWKYYRVLLQGELGATPSVLESLRRIVALNPQFPQAWLRLGDAALKQGQSEEAQAAYRSALAAVPDDAPESKPFPLRAYATFGLARLALARGQPDDARRILEPLTQAHATFGPAHRLLAEAYRKLGRDREAAQRIARAAACGAYQPPQDPLIDALARESCNSTFLLKQMDLAKLAGNRPWAERLGRRALEVNPADRDVPLQLAKLMLAFGRADDAVSLVDRYQRMPDRDAETVADTCNGLALAYARAGRLQEAGLYYRQAIRHYQETIRAKPHSPRAYANLGFAFEQLGLQDQALAVYGEAARLQPGDAEAQLRPARVLFSLGRLEQAQHHAAAALALSPYDAAARHLLANIASRNGQHAEAEKLYRDTLRYAPDYVLARLNLGNLLERQGRWADAAECYRDGLKESPDDPRLAGSAAWLMATCPRPELRQGAQAVTLAEWASQSAGHRDPVLLEALAAAYAEAGRFDRAVAAQQAAVQLGEPGAGPKLREQMRARLDLYQLRKPFRQPDHP